MTNKEYKNFREMVEVANSLDPVWWMGFAWLNLTEKQCHDMISLLRVHPCITKDVEAKTLKMPSGMTFSF